MSLVAYPGMPWQVAASVEGSDSCPGTADSSCPCGVPVVADLWPLPLSPAKNSGAGPRWPPPRAPILPQHKLHGFSISTVFPCHLILVLGSGLSWVPSTLRGPGTHWWAKCWWQSRRELPPSVFKALLPTSPWWG